MAVRKINWNVINDEMKNLGKKDEKPKYEKKVDENLYKIKMKDGKSTVLLRFLPTPEGDLEMPIAEVHSHSYKSDSGKWLIHKCPKTVSKTAKCPTCDHGSKLWNGGEKDNATNFFKKTKFFVNVLIIQDFNTPENDGKIFVMMIGKKLLEKINKKMYPSEEDLACGEEAVNVFDYEEGMNFKMVVKEIVMKNTKTGKEETQRNFDSSEWSKTSTKISIDPKKPLTDAEINTLIEPNLIQLAPYVKLDSNENYEALKVRLDKFLGFVDNAPTEAPDGSSDEDMTAQDFIKHLAGGN